MVLIIFKKVVVITKLFCNIFIQRLIMLVPSAMTCTVIQAISWQYKIIMHYVHVVCLIRIIVLFNLQYKNNTLHLHVHRISRPINITFEKFMHCFICAEYYIRNHLMCNKGHNTLHIYQDERILKYDYRYNHGFKKFKICNICLLNAFIEFH